MTIDQETLFGSQIKSKSISIPGMSMSLVGNSVDTRKENALSIFDKKEGSNLRGQVAKGIYKLPEKKADFNKLKSKSKEWTLVKKQSVLYGIDIFDDKSLANYRCSHSKNLDMNKLFDKNIQKH